MLECDFRVDASVIKPSSSPAQVRQLDTNAYGIYTWSELKDSGAGLFYGLVSRF